MVHARQRQHPGGGSTWFKTDSPAQTSSLRSWCWRRPKASRSSSRSASELEVLRLIAEGLANTQIAARLYIEVGTVKRHINHIFGKLGVASRTQAITRARALKLI